MDCRDSRFTILDLQFLLRACRRSGKNLCRGAIRLVRFHHGNMAHQFAPGDDLIFQIESGLGLLRILAIDGEGAETVWHLLSYDQFFPDVESAEKALSEPQSLSIRKAHMALTDRAFERTPAARLGNREVTEEELDGYRDWVNSDERKVSDRSALLLLGIR
jgi:hypothetical protein